MNMRNLLPSLALAITLMAHHGVSFGDERQAYRAPDGRLPAIDSPYGRLIAESQKTGYVDPMNFVLSRLDAPGLELLLDNGHELNPQGYRPQLPLEIAIENHARSDKTERPAHLSFIEAMLRLGADPLHKGGAPVETALSWGETDLAILLLNHRRGSLYRVHVWETTINEQLENDENLAKAFLTANRAVPEGIASLALDGENPRLWRAAVESRLPLAADMLYWINGQPSILGVEDMKKLVKPGAVLVKAHLDSVGKRLPAVGDDVNLWAYYLTDHISLLVSARGPYSMALENDFLAYATSLCMHRLGEHCGPDELLRQSEEWLDQARIDCLGEPAMYLDQWLCRLGMIYVEKKPLEISIFFKEANSSEEHYAGLEAFCRLGQHSIRSGAEPLKALQTECRPIFHAD